MPGRHRHVLCCGLKTNYAKDRNHDSVSAICMLWRRWRTICGRAIKYMADLQPYRGISRASPQATVWNLRGQDVSLPVLGRRVPHRRQCAGSRVVHWLHGIADGCRLLPATEANRQDLWLQRAFNLVRRCHVCAVHSGQGARLWC